MVSFRPALDAARRATFLDPISEVGEHARLGRRWTRPRVQHREDSDPSWNHTRSDARDVFREGAENSARGGRAPHFNKAVLVAGLVATAALHAAEPHAVLDAWLAGQTNVRAWSAVCVQTRSLQTLAQPLVSTGRVWFAAPDRFRWELGQPAQTIAVRRGDELTLSYPRLRRAERYSLGENRSGPWRDALALLEAGFPRDRAQLDRQFRLLSVTATNDTWELSLQPGRPAARRFIGEVRVALANQDCTLRATELVFADGSRMRNDFREIVVNPPIDDAMFRPPVEAGYTVTDPLAR